MRETDLSWIITWVRESYPLNGYWICSQLTKNAIVYNFEEVFGVDQPKFWRFFVQFYNRGRNVLYQSIESVQRCFEDEMSARMKFFQQDSGAIAKFEERDLSITIKSSLNKPPFWEPRQIFYLLFGKVSWSIWNLTSFNHLPQTKKRRVHLLKNSINTKTQIW